MAYLKEDFVRRIVDRQNDDADILRRVMDDICGEPRHEGKELAYTCPHCGSHALKYTPGSSKHIFRCFSCNEVSGKSAVNFLMSPAVGKSYAEAVEYVATLYGEVPEYEQEKRPARPRPAKKGKGEKEKEDSFCRQMLESSGLTKDDITACVYQDAGDSHPTKLCTFQKGTMTASMEIDHEGDDMVIFYYDIEGKPCVYTPKVKGKGDDVPQRRYWRVRYQFPDEHKDKAGKPMKYKSPPGSPSFIPI